MDWDEINTRRRMFGVAEFSESYMRDVRETFFELTKG
jgi:hypothetical protein